VPANDIARRLGNDKAANMVILGAYIGATRVLDPAVVIATMRDKMASKAGYLDSNEAAILAGIDADQEAVPHAA
jgi:2-oxoglutarate ferredoxin oxidoreductase subunit gamma